MKEKQGQIRDKGRQRYSIGKKNRCIEQVPQSKVQEYCKKETLEGLGNNILRENTDKDERKKIHETKLGWHNGKTKTINRRGKK